MRLDHAGAVKTHILNIFQLTIFKPKQIKRVKCAADPGRGHLWHRPEKGGTERHFGRPIWQEWLREDKTQKSNMSLKKSTCFAKVP